MQKKKGVRIVWEKKSNGGGDGLILLDINSYYEVSVIRIE